MLERVEVSNVYLVQDENSDKDAVYCYSSSSGQSCGEYYNSTRARNTCEDVTAYMPKDALDDSGNLRSQDDMPPQEIHFRVASKLLCVERVPAES